jgi:hypothetical protein
MKIVSNTKNIRARGEGTPLVCLRAVLVLTNGI